MINILARLARWGYGSLLCAGLISLTLGGAATSSFAAGADTILINAKIYTVNPQKPWAEALAIQGDKIVAVGTTREISAQRKPNTKLSRLRTASSRYWNRAGGEYMS